MLPPRPLRVRRRAAVALLLAVGLAACDGARTFRERVAPAAPSDRYAARLREAGLADAALGREWIAARDAAMRAPTAVTAPYRERGYVARDEARAAAWVLSVKRGQRLRVHLAARASDATTIFVDLFRLDADSAARAVAGGAAREPERVAGVERHTELRADSAPVVTVDAAEAARYLVRIQPELLRSVEYEVTIETGASLGFPVAGRDARATRSFWGDSRDAGARRHEGVDIFAARGTPAVAAVDGTVGNVGETRLGGRVVWLSDAAHGQSLYYAHLDRQLVAAGDRVRAGDTLGLVGNTGNARTTPPHLHFGVYRRGRGAVDPYPFIDEPRAGPAAPTETRLGAWRRVSARDGAALLGAPGAGGAVTRLAPLAPVRVESAAAGGWLRVRAADGTEGWLRLAATADAERAPLARREAGPVRERPRAGAPTLEAGGVVEVLGREGGHDFVRTAAGRVGWTE